mmetsp:Transcript_81690/g.229136  ORF Transcript_81690/g.229136 Transcript_81690/m.229136 type:complete len:217 (-) Transcript_81690:130-780(-)
MICRANSSSTWPNIRKQANFNSSALNQPSPLMSAPLKISRSQLWTEGASKSSFHPMALKSSFAACQNSPKSTIVSRFWSTIVNKNDGSGNEGCACERIWNRAGSDDFMPGKISLSKKSWYSNSRGSRRPSLSMSAASKRRSAKLNTRLRRSGSAMPLSSTMSRVNIMYSSLSKTPSSSLSATSKVTTPPAAPRPRAAAPNSTKPAEKRRRLSRGAS